MGSIACITTSLDGLARLIERGPRDVREKHPTMFESSLSPGQTDRATIESMLNLTRYLNLRTHVHTPGVQRKVGVANKTKGKSQWYKWYRRLAVSFEHVDVRCEAAAAAEGTTTMAHLSQVRTAVPR